MLAGPSVELVESLKHSRTVTYGDPNILVITDQWNDVSTESRILYQTQLIIIMIWFRLVGGAQFRLVSMDYH
jgi:hypothetical protein